jgi:SAM-dependent methyltransferase
MHDFHQNRQWYFEMQTLNAKKYVIPFIEEKLKLTEGMKVLEVGCGEGGVLLAFVQKGCQGVGVDMDEARIAMAKDFMPVEIAAGNIEMHSADIYDPLFESKFENAFDLIVLKDVIEHIHDQEKIMAQFKRYLKPGGHIYFGFPPFDMPFGGHQQVSSNRLFSKLPWTHILPMSIYKAIMNTLGVKYPDQFIEVKETGISTSRFEKICQKLNYEFVHSRHYIFNPIYEYKFGLKPKVQFDFVRNLPFLRDYFTTCVYYLIKK